MNFRNLSLIRVCIRCVFHFKLKKIVKYKNEYRGQTCYLWGDGVSIKHFDLSAFPSHVSIAGNYLRNHVQFRELNVKFWLFITPMFFWPLAFRKNNKNFKNERAWRRHYSPRRLKDSQVISVMSLTNWPFTAGTRSLYIFDKFPASDKPDLFFRKDILAGTVNASVALAVYLGFENAYLIGFDYTHATAHQGHWYERGHGSVVNQDEYNKDFFAVASKYINLITVTLDGPGRILQSITYEELTSRKPSYRENFELTDSRNLEILDGQLGYTVY